MTNFASKTSFSVVEFFRSIKMNRQHNQICPYCKGKKHITNVIEGDYVCGNLTPSGCIPSRPPIIWKYIPTRKVKTTCPICNGKGEISLALYKRFEKEVLKRISKYLKSIWKLVLEDELQKSHKRRLRLK